MLLNQSYQNLNTNIGSPNMPQNKQPNLQDLLIRPPNDQKISAVPLQFEYIPVQILSKQFTKFNNPHKYRIHYLGPRPVNSFILHKKYGSIQYQVNRQNPVCSKDYNKYKVNMRRIVQSSLINQGLRTNNHYKSAIFYRAFEGMNPTLNLNEEIIFNSAFQSGNLDCVIKYKANSFDLFLRIDSNTRGHTQWYYFSVKNGKKGQHITLNICNITKGGNLYQQGMRPYIFSRKKKQKLGQYYSWQQGGQNIKFQAKLLRYDLIYQKIRIPQLFQLSFDYEFEFDDDEVFFSYSIPFTYSQLLNKIYQLPKQIVKNDILGQTFTGLDIPILHITNFQSQVKRKEKKHNILITSRVHPGQSNSSHMVNGLIDFVISDAKQAQQLRNRVNFFIVPMLNPDGVIMGNSRVGGAGKDLNRQFRSSKFQIYPEVQLIKNFAYKLKKKNGLYMYLDFHGHSRKKNTFFYGPPYIISEVEYYKCRILPRIIQKINNSFRYYSCSFNLNQQKKRTARGVMFEQLKIPYTYTIQSSIGLYYDFQGKNTVEFEEIAWKIMGKDISLGLCEFLILEQQYQLLMKERIFNRAKAKQLKLINNKIMKEQAKQTFIQQNQKQQKISAFQDLLFEIKQNCSKHGAYDQQIQSDDHNANQDLQDIKLNQFNNLMVQGIQKSEISPIKNKQFIQDIFINQFPSKQLQTKIQAKQSQNFLNSSQKYKKLTISQNFKFRNRSLLTKSQNIQKRKQRQKLQQKNVQLPSPNKTDILHRTTNKNFVLANKQRYSLTTKNFLLSESINKYEVIELPKHIQNIRKQLTKGRILINNLFENKIKLQNSRNQKSSNISKTSNQFQGLSPQRIIFTSMKIKRSGQLKELTLSPQKIQNKNNYNFVTKKHSNLQHQRRSSTSQMNRKQIINNVKQQSLKNMTYFGTRKNTIQNFDYQKLGDFQIDNIAMTIKSFNGNRQ